MKLKKINFKKNSQIKTPSQHGLTQLICDLGYEIRITLQK